MNLICGINPVLEALSARTRHFDRLLVVKGLRNRRVSEAITQASRLGISLRFEARETLDRLAGGVPHQGLIAVVSAKPAMSLESVVEHARTPALLVALDGVEDPRNLGAILRTAEAAGADGVLIPDRHSAGLSETVARSSAGALEHVKVARVGNLVQALETLKARGYWVVGFDASATQRWDAVDLKGPVVLVLGGEGRGIRRLVREHCDHLAALPLFGHVGSLNVSVAAGIALYEAVRQRGTVPSHVRPIAQRPASARHIQGPSAGDEEHDPGASRGAHGEGDPVDPSWEPAPLVLLDDEDAAWAAGPTVLKAVSSSSRRTRPERPRDGKRRQKGRRGERSDRGGERPDRGEPADRGERRDAAPPAAEGAAPHTPSSPEAGQGPKSRRRRRRRGRGPKPEGETQAASAAPPRPEPGGSAPPTEGAPEARDDRPRRRRRRRR
ncbi:MAG: 23S rRNA (guanosine(2251)-2'-O)-methyltransferase RlmB [Vicinamibacteria bacterium]